MSPGLRSCRLARAAILQDLDGELALERVLALEAHVATCRACAAFRARAASLEEGLRAGSEPATQRGELEGALAGILARLDAPAEPAPLPLTRERPALVGVVAAALLLLAGFAMWRGLAGRTRTPAPAPELAALAPAPADAGPPAVLDPARVAGIVRENLLVAFAGEVLALDVEPLVRAFELRSGAIQSWPLARVAEALLEDPDRRVAASAARYVGLRGDRVSVPRLAAVLARPGVGPAAVRALGDLARRATGTEEVTTEALRMALRDPELAPLALDVLGRLGGAGPARVLEQGFREGAFAPGSPERERWLASLARTGPAAVASILRLAEPSAPELLERLGEVEGAGEELVRLLEHPAPNVSRERLFDAVERLQPARALPWVEARCSEPRQRTRALQCLAAWRDTAGVRAFLRLDELGTVPEPELGACFRLFAERGPARLAAAVEHLEGLDEATLATRYLDLLLASESPSAAPALVALARARMLSSAERARAALGLSELGGPDEARALLAELGQLGNGERELCAAILITAWHALEPTEVHDALGILNERGARRVEAALAEVDERGASPVALARVSRALQGALLPKTPNLQPLL